MAKESLPESSLFHIVIQMTLLLLIIKDLRNSFMIFTPKELPISEITESASVASYLDIPFPREKFYGRHTDLVGQYMKMSAKCLLIDQLNDLLFLQICHGRMDKIS